MTMVWVAVGVSVAVLILAFAAVCLLSEDPGSDRLEWDDETCPECHRPLGGAVGGTCGVCE